MNLAPPDVYFKKLISFHFNNLDLQFRVSQDLFSSQNVDIGTNLLLRTIVSGKKINPQKVLDLGCGYGVIGITLKALDKNREVHAVDRDSLAVQYSQQNSILNELEDIKSYGSLGFDDVKDSDFDLIVFNIPAKVGDKAIAYFLKNAGCFLKQNGIVAIVVVSPLLPVVKPILDSESSINVVFQKDSPSYSVFHYKYTQPISSVDCKTTGINQGVYSRGKQDFTYKNNQYFLEVSKGVSEFDTLDFQTEMVFDELLSVRTNQLSQMLCMNTGQGHIPVMASKLLKLTHLILIDRDLLSLRISQRNLELNGYPSQKVELLHNVNLPEEKYKNTDLIVLKLRDEEGRRSSAQNVMNALTLLTQDGKLIVVAGSTTITRVIEDLHLKSKIKHRRKYKGQSLITLNKVNNFPPKS